MPSINDILAFVGSVFAILIVLPMHEFAHAFAAVKCGDETPRVYGRYTLNPFKHFDLFGLISLLIVHFGWAKPVPINPVNFKHYRRDYFWVSVAGVLANLIGSFLFYPHFRSLTFSACSSTGRQGGLRFPSNGSGG